MGLVQTYSDRKVSMVSPRPDDLAYLVYTSGTTGPAKGAMIRHRNVLHNAIVYQEACRLDRSDVVLGVAPLFHITGIVAHQAIAFHLGIPIVLLARFDVQETLRLIEKYRVTFIVASITVYIAMLNHPQLKGFDLSRLKESIQRWCAGLSQHRKTILRRYGIDDLQCIRADRKLFTGNHHTAGNGGPGGRAYGCPFGWTGHTRSCGPDCGPRESGH